MYGKGALLRAMIDGLFAQRKLKGDPDIIASDDPDVLRSIVAQGKRAEESCRREGYSRTIEHAYAHAEVPLKKDGNNVQEA